MARISALGRLFKRTSSAATLPTTTTTTTTDTIDTTDTTDTIDTTDTTITNNTSTPPTPSTTPSPNTTAAPETPQKLRQESRGRLTAESGQNKRRRSGSLTRLSGRLRGADCPEIVPLSIAKHAQGRGEQEEKEDIVALDPPIVEVEAPTPDPEGQELLGHEAVREQDRVSASYCTSSRSEQGSGGRTRSVSPNTIPSDGSPLRQLSNSRHIEPPIKQTQVDAPADGKQHEKNLNTSSWGPPTSALADYFTPGVTNMAQLPHRKIWVRRPGASATLVQIKTDDLVDDVRDMILRKYANSLGRTFDAPDMTLRIQHRAEPGQQRLERVLAPEEDMCRTIDAEYQGGQTVEDALIIDVPTRERRTPRPSPRMYQQSNAQNYHLMEDYRPMESGNDYFPPMPPQGIPPTATSQDGTLVARPHNMHHASVAGLEPRSIAVLSTGQIPPLPSPGSMMRSRAHPAHRPKAHRQHTSSPTTLPAHNGHSISTNTTGIALSTNNQPSLNVNPQIPLPHRGSVRPRNDSMASDAHSAVGSIPNGPAPPPPTPPAPETLAGHPINGAPATASQMANAALARGGLRTKKAGGRKITPEKAGQVASRAGPGRRGQEAQESPGPPHALTNGASNLSGMLDSSVPPISVLIVEDNIINLRILEGLMKRLKVRWQTAMNGQIALDKWRQGGYHLVLMDIQMPVMNGLQATKEIRRLERVNGIGAFSAEGSPVLEKNGNGNGVVGENGEEDGTEPKDSAKAASKKPTDLLTTVTPDGAQLFKSPVIIVALTASSLQSDRHEALAAGCNDFLTKPVSFVWLERKVKEWGCMQALIDFDGWRRWKEFAVREEEGKGEGERAEDRRREEKEKKRMEKMAKLQELAARRKEEEEQKKKKRGSLGPGAQGSSEGGSATGTTGTSNGALVDPGTIGLVHAEDGGE
ncbi:hypothetical protein LTR62_002500 [Meristemomyces frigidus]|uniref:Response regulatory domain-containing protein n=1 Tax=Meristemomyces frigidus TaxID=1508187 RepID=A0AAN7T8K1_9PEZI|nr:hypothetical protein LTR62_002500 [Meristemomyces frigidus]